MLKPALALVVALSLAACCNCPDARVEQTQPLAELPEGAFTEADYRQLATELASRMHCRVAHGEPEKCALLLTAFENGSGELAHEDQREKLLSELRVALEGHGFHVRFGPGVSSFPIAVHGGTIRHDTHTIAVRIETERGALAHYVLEATIQDVTTKETKKLSSSLWKRPRTT